MKSPTLIALLFFFVAGEPIGAAPIITSISPTAARPGETLTLNGSGFSVSLAGNKINVGGIAVTPATANSTQLTLKVPNGATLGPITVVADGGLAQSRESFVPMSRATERFRLAEPVAQEIHAFHHRMAVGDVDGDSRPDVITSHHDGGNGSTSQFGVYLNHFDGTPLGTDAPFPSTILGSEADAYFKTTGEITGDVELADFNNDGRLDVVVSDHFKSSVSVCQNNSSAGAVRFGDAVHVSTGGSSGAVGVAVGDVDGDGRLDIIAAVGNGGIRVVRNTHSGGSLGSTSFAAGIHVLDGTRYAVAVADFNNDGRPDIAATSWGNGAFVVLENTSTGPGVISFLPHSYPVRGASAAHEIRAADFDRDGLIDVLIPNDNGSATVRFVQNTATDGVIGPSSFTTAITVPGEDGASAPFAAAGELTGDELPEGLLSRIADLPFNVFENTSSQGTLSMSRGPGAYIPEHTYAIEVADFDGDGLNDIVTCTPNGTKSIYLIRNLGESAPVADADYAFCTTNGVLIDVLENDVSPDGLPLTITSVTQSADGGVASIQGNKIFYDPLRVAITKPRTFTYTVTDGRSTQTAIQTIYPPPALGYTYTGHLFDTDGTTIRGLLTMQMTRAGGQYTGLIYVSSKLYRIKGSFSRESPSPGFAGASETNPGVPVRISAGPLDESGFPRIKFFVPGTLPETRWRGMAERSPYFRLSRSALVSPAAGKYTMVFEQPAGSAQPAVAGACSVVVRPAATAIITGKQGNGLSLSTRGYLLSGDRMPFYVPAARGSAFQSLAGTLVFVPTSDRDIGGSVLWSVPPGLDSRIPGGLARSYPVLGSRYRASLTRLSPPNQMLGYNPAGAATISLELPSSNRIVNIARNIGTITTIDGVLPLKRVTLAPSTGYFVGTFSDQPYTSNATFRGFVLQHPAQNRGSGYVLDTDRLGCVSLTPTP